MRARESNKERNLAYSNIWQKRRNIFDNSMLPFDPLSSSLLFALTCSLSFFTSFILSVFYFAFCSFLFFSLLTFFSSTFTLLPITRFPLYEWRVTGKLSEAKMAFCYTAEAIILVTKVRQQVKHKKKEKKTRRDNTTCKTTSVRV